MKRLKILYTRQEGRCFYCGLPTYLAGGGETKIEARQRLGVPAKAKGLRRRRATIDHIYPKAFGGMRSWNNIVMACTLCNSKKGTMNVNDFISRHLPR